MADFRLLIEPNDDGSFVATSPDVPGLVAQGISRMDAVEIAEDVARQIKQVCLDHGDPVPEALQ